MPQSYKWQCIRQTGVYLGARGASGIESGVLFTRSSFGAPVTERNGFDCVLEGRDPELDG